MYKNPRLGQKPARSKKRVIVFGVLAIVLLLLAGGGWILANQLSDKPKVSQSLRTTNEKGETADNTAQDNPQDKQDSPPNAPPSKEGDEPTSPTTNAPLTDPTGTFISNHRPSLSNSAAIESVCNTTRGAKCNIILTKGGVTKSLGEKATDADGAVYWSWNLQEKGITEGTWEVTAVATLNGETKSVKDPISLEVKP